MRNDGEDAQLDQARYRASEQSAPYVPPKPKPPRDVPMAPEDPTVPDVRMDDQITGGPPPPPAPRGGGYAQWLQRPNATAQGLAAEGVRPAPPPPPPPQLTEYSVNPQPPPPPPGSGSVAMAYPATRPQSFAPGVLGYTGPPQTPPLRQWPSCTEHGLPRRPTSVFRTRSFWWLHRPATTPRCWPSRTEPGSHREPLVRVSCWQRRWSCSRGCCDRRSSRSHWVGSTDGRRGRARRCPGRSRRRSRRWRRRDGSSGSHAQRRGWRQLGSLQRRAWYYLRVPATGSQH
jgi:hypothetical protein